MGVGNWSWRSSSGLPTTVVHVDGVLRYFDDYREEAEKKFVEYVREHYADRLPEDEEPTLEWAKSEGLGAIIEAAIGDEFPDWDDQDGYSQQEAKQRFDDLLDRVVEVFGESKLPGLTQHYPMLTPEFDKAAHVLARSEWAQVVVRQWEGMIYFGVGPSDAIEDLGDLNLGTVESKFIEKVWAACDPKSTAFYLAADKKPAPIELTQQEQAMSVLVRQYGYRPNGDLLTSVVERLRAQAAELDNYNANLQFFNDFGITPHDLATLNVEIEGLIAFVEEYGGTPDMVAQGYERDRQALRSALLTAMAIEGEKPYSPDTAWTSKRVDLSPFRQVAVVHLDRINASACIVNQDPLKAIGSAAPGSVSFMSEAEFEQSVMDSVERIAPHKVLELNDGMFSIHSPMGGLRPHDHGVLVFRGRLEWGHFDGYNKQVEKWLQQGGTSPLEQLPGWMKLATSGPEIRSILDSLPAGSKIAECYDKSGDLQVTGALVETRNGAYSTVFVTTESKPHMLSASYEPLVLNGVAIKPASPTTDHEATYG